MFQQKTASNNCTLFLCQVLITNGFLSLKVVGALAAKHGRSASQILGKWQWAEHWGHREHRVVLEFALSVQPRCIQKGFQHIPKSEKRSRPQRALRPLCDVVQLGSRMEENARLFDFELDTEAPPPKLRTAIPCFERGMHLGRIWDKLENLTTPAALETFKLVPQTTHVHVHRSWTAAKAHQPEQSFRHERPDNCGSTELTQPCVRRGPPT